MATETLNDTLLLGTGVDLAGLQAGLAGATRLLDSFSDGLSLDQTGSTIANGLIDNLRATFAQRSTDLKRELADGIVDPTQFSALAQESANEFAVGLARGLSTLSTAGLDTPDVERQFAAAFAGIGANAGAALAAAIEQTTATSLHNQAAGATELANTGLAAAATMDKLAESSQALAVTTERANEALDHNARSLGIVSDDARAASAAFQSMQLNAQHIGESIDTTTLHTRLLGGEIENMGDHFTHAGRRGIEALFGVGLAVTALASNANDVTTRIDQTLQTISGFGLLLGEKGLIVSAAATAIEAVIAVVTRGNEEMKKAAAEFNQQVQQMILSADQAGLQRKIFDIQTIDPRAEKALGQQDVGLDAMKEHLDSLKATLATMERPENQLGNLLAIGPAQKAITDFQATMKPLQDDVERLQKALGEVPGQLKGVTVTAFDPTVVSEDVKKLTDQLQALGSVAPEVNDRLKGLTTPGFLPLTQQGQKLADTINQQALASVDRLTARLAAQHGVVDADTLALLQMVKQFDQFDAVKILRFKVPELSQEKLEVTIADLELLVPKPPTIPVHIEPDIKGFDPQEFQAIAQQLVDLQSKAAALATAGDTQGAQQARVAAVQQTQLLADSEQDVLAHLVAMHAPASVVAEVFARMQDTMKALGVDMTAVAVDLNPSNLVNGLRTVAQDVGALNTAFGETATKAGQALDAVATLVEQVKALNTTFGSGATFAGVIGSVTSIVGAIGTIGGLVGSLFGESPTQKEHDQILVQNNEALEQLRISLNNFGQTGTSLNQVIEAVAHLHIQGKNGIDALASSALTAEQAMDVLRQGLKGTGVSLAELQAVAKQNGITLLDSKGHIVAGALDALQKALDATSDKILKFADDFTSQVNLQELIDKALGKSSPALDFSDFQKEFQQQAPFAFTDFFGNLGGADFTHLTQQQVAEFKADIARLLKAIQDGSISLTELGTFTDVGQLEQAAQAWLDALDGMSSAADAVTQSLLNVPTGFKLALAEFNATTPADLIPHPGTPSNPVITPPIQTIPTHVGIDDPVIGGFFHTLSTSGMPIDDRSIATMADKLADAIRNAGGGSGTLIFTGDINVTAGDRDAAQLTDDILEQLRTRARTGLKPLAGVLT